MAERTVDWLLFMLMNGTEASRRHISQRSASKRAGRRDEGVLDLAVDFVNPSAAVMWRATLRLVYDDVYTKESA